MTTHLSYNSSLFSNLNHHYTHLSQPPPFCPKFRRPNYSLHVALHSSSSSSSYVPKLGSEWMEYHGVNNWDGLLDPLHDTLRSEILRYGHFVEAAYDSFDFDPCSSSYASCKFSRNSLLPSCGLPSTGYVVTKHLRSTCGVHLPRWIDRGPSHWLSKRSTWIGYVAVCQDKEEIKRLGRRDVVIAFRGTATCLEWLENLRVNLTCFPDGERIGRVDDAPMVESGFLSMYTSGSATCPSLQSMVKDEVAKIAEAYGGGKEDEPPLSFTITGHSLGAALAILSAHDINNDPSLGGGGDSMVTVMSFGGPRVGNRSFRRQLERGGVRVLRIVNSDDVITKVPGFVVDNGELRLPTWIKRRVKVTPWVYAEVGKELRLSSRAYLKNMDVATCHELSTYLQLVNGFVSSTCPFRATAMRSKVFNEHHREKLGF
ncbi:Phospholipase A(1) DAD1, chloroplastic [Linum grandiflorum]